MSIEGNDLERAGTRSRRQLSNSKQYSLFPPEDPSVHPFGKRASNVFNRKSRYFILICVTTVILLVLFFSRSSLFKVKSSTQKQKTTLTLSESTQFKDSTQFTDYALINRLISEKQDLTTSSSRLNMNDLDVITPGQNLFTHKLSKETTIGHTFDELRRLTNSIPLPYLSSSSKQNRRVSVTTIIHTKSVTQLYIQVQSVLTQTALPEHIWIICDTSQKSEVEARIMTLDRRRVKVMSSDYTREHEWIQTTSQISTDFVWLIDQNIAPGKRYLENILKLSLTKQYKSALLGTEAATLNVELENKIECIPYIMHSGSRQMRSKAVDMVNDSWLLHRSWVPFLLEAMNKQNNDVSNPILGLFISRVLYMNAGIPSIALPTDPIERAYWGDIRLQKTQKSETCKALENSIMQGEKPESLALYDDLHYRNNRVKNSEVKPVLVYIDSVEELEALAPLVCRFEKKEEVDLHIVTGSNISQQIKSYITSVCHQNETLIHVFVHDISIVHELPNWSFINDLLHRLNRIMAAVQPQIFIHSVQQENPIFESIQATSEMWQQVTTIYLPTQDISHALWMTELPLDTLSKWNSFSIKVMITTDKKPHALARLLNSATTAHYLGDDIDLSIIMDHSTDLVTQTFANNFKWKKGTKNIRHRIAQTNKAPIFVESWYPANNDEYAIILNNDIELSRYYYSWAKYSILRYRYLEPEKSRNLFGVSLYAPPLQETDPEGRHWFSPSQVLTKAGLPQKSHKPYVMQWPSYSGAVFFPEHWREFHDYITARVADNIGFSMQDIMVPDLRSNGWIRSWRRYFEELIYLRSYVMLYPNFEGNSSSLSTLHLELKKKTMREEFADAISIYNVPLMEQDRINDLELPSYKDLPVFDIWGELSNHEELKERGLDLHEQVSACSPPLEEDHQYDPTDLLCPFARIVSVTLENENDTLPELPTIEVTVYN